MKFLHFLKYYRESFGAKIFFLLTLFTLIIYASFIAFFIYYQSKTQKQHLISEGNQLVKLLAYSSRLGVFTENGDLLKDPIEGILQYKEVTAIHIFTSDGRELKTLERPDKETPKSPQPPFIKGGIRGGLLEQRTIDILRKSKSTFYSESDGKIEFWAPVISSGGHSEEALFFREDSHKKDNIIGFVRIIFTTELLNKSLRDILLKSILIPVFLFIPIWIVIYFIVKGVIKPLDKLTEGVKAIGAGDSVEKISVET
jgi:hypothetical protein